MNVLRCSQIQPQYCLGCLLFGIIVLTALIMGLVWEM